VKIPEFEEGRGRGGGLARRTASSYLVLVERTILPWTGCILRRASLGFAGLRFEGRAAKVSLINENGKVLYRLDIPKMGSVKEPQGEK